MDFHSIINGISKCEAIKLFQNIDLTEKVEYYKNKYQEQFWSCNGKKRKIINLEKYKKF